MQGRDCRGDEVAHAAFGAAALPSASEQQEADDVKDRYHDQAVACVKDRVLPAQLELHYLVSIIRNP